MLKTWNFAILSGHKLSKSTKFNEYDKMIQIINNQATLAEKIYESGICIINSKFNGF